MDDDAAGGRAADLEKAEVGRFELSDRRMHSTESPSVSKSAGRMEEVDRIRDILGPPGERPAAALAEAVAVTLQDVGLLGTTLGSHISGFSPVKEMECSD